MIRRFDAGYRDGAVWTWDSEKGYAVWVWPAHRKREPESSRYDIEDAVRFVTENGWFEIVPGLEVGEGM